MKSKYRVEFKEITEYAPLEIEARNENEALKIYRRYYLRGLIGRSLSPTLHEGVSLVREEIEPNNVPPTMRDEKGLVKPLDVSKE